ncbi:hypothetical protein WA026_008273 [Henosepilachna vigintioctopunctata]|uniref:Uncharacterized protein n=1 Tax=Henosepilachna vigintioctopunctata TaxID=420089 RepID=A0AAW1TIT6_9CUCU
MLALLHSFETSREDYRKLRKSNVPQHLQISQTISVHSCPSNNQKPPIFTHIEKLQDQYAQRTGVSRRCIRLPRRYTTPHPLACEISVSVCEKYRSARYQKCASEMSVNFQLAIN